MNDDNNPVHAFESLKLYRRGSQVSLNKPITLLYALGRLHTAGDTFLAYAQIEDDLQKLLSRYGSIGQPAHPEYAFRRLARDRRPDGGLVWRFEPEDLIAQKEDPSARKLREVGAHGGLALDLIAAFDRKPDLVHTVATAIARDYIPEAIRKPLLDAVGLHLALGD